MKLSRRDEGYALFFEEPGEKDSVKCRVCGAECEVERNIVLYQVGMIRRGKFRYDLFKCPYREDPNHEKACEILERLDAKYPPRGPAERRAMEEDVKHYVSLIDKKAE